MTTQSTRMHKLTCICGSTARMSMKQIAAGVPTCACGARYTVPPNLPAPVPATPLTLDSPAQHTPDVRDNLNGILAAVAGGFIPVASYVLAHIEATGRTYLYALVAAALVFSAPTLAAWAERWCDGRWKAWGFCALLEGVMILSDIRALNLVGLAILLGINSAYAWERARVRRVAA